jgi:hypothetical protein
LYRIQESRNTSRAGSGYHRNFTVTHHCQKRDGIHERRLLAWAGEVPADRVKRRTTRVKWVSKSRGRDQLSIQWELGIRDDGHSMFLDRSHMMKKYRTCEDSTLKGKFLSDPEFVFTLEAYVNDTPAPNILPKESNRVLQSIIDS